MSTKYTKGQLEAMGLDEAQINAVLATQADESEKVVPEKVISIATAQANANMSVTSIGDLQQYASGTVVRLPDFGAGQPFVAKLRRPSMLVLAKQGKIPNGLLTAAGELFTKGGNGMDADNTNMLSDMYDIMHIICESALVQPTLQEIENSGLSLSDEQMTAIFNYTQTGIKALESFR